MRRRLARPFAYSFPVLRSNRHFCSRTKMLTRKVRKNLFQKQEFRKKIPEQIFSWSGNENTFRWSNIIITTDRKIFTSTLIHLNFLVLFKENEKVILNKATINSVKFLAPKLNNLMFIMILWGKKMAKGASSFFFRKPSVRGLDDH